MDRSNPASRVPQCVALAMLSKAHLIERRLTFPVLLLLQVMRATVIFIELTI